MSETVAEPKAALRAGVAEEIRALLGRRRMTSVALARAIGKSHTYVWRRLSGETAFDVDDMAGIASALGVPVISLFPEEARSVTNRSRQEEELATNRSSHTRPHSTRPGDNRPLSRTDHVSPVRPSFLRPVDQRVIDPTRRVQEDLTR